MYFVVKVSAFMNGTRLDKNGNPAVYLEAQNGVLPERARVLSGTIAKQKGLEVGNLYILMVTDLGESEYGTNYKHDNIGQVSALEFAMACNRFPSPVVHKAAPAAKVQAPAMPILAEVGDEVDF